MNITIVNLTERQKLKHCPQSQCARPFEETCCGCGLAPFQPAREERLPDAASFSPEELSGEDQVPGGNAQWDGFPPPAAQNEQAGLLCNGKESEAALPALITKKGSRRAPHKRAPVKLFICELCGKKTKYDKKKTKRCRSCAKKRQAALSRAWKKDHKDRQAVYYDKWCTGHARRAAS